MEVLRAGDEMVELLDQVGDVREEVNALRTEMTDLHARLERVVEQLPHSRSTSRHPRVVAEPVFRGRAGFDVC